ncbi:carbohydrate ABC transporter permease [Jiangella rhizosphaerae]|uniref:Carbohydrate ABC transporter permease n=1 Tax=Jiangella rhizosphaerae TaxID=2293569 RepID=A0A418KQM3_9ACTN|nr:carbohydrate ABC transporter permease [Jiangella rhizosphaerae]RIQ22866.1 carbohydrate ABC transporter permease [Jiangella rhizosphaerae]
MNARAVAPRTAAAVLVSVLFLIPLWWVVASSFRPRNTAFAYTSPFGWEALIPVGGDVSNYSALFNGYFLRAVGNSLFVAAVTVVLGLALSVFAAFALSVLRFRGRELVFGLVVLSFLIPFDAIAIPMSGQFRDWGLSNSYLGLILPGLANGFAIFVLRQFFLGIPRELLEAARIDGLGWGRILVQVYLPLCRPALVGAGLMLFLSQWQAYVWPLLIGTDSEHHLAPIALANLRRQLEVDFGQIFAGSVVLTLVPGLLLLAFQRHFTESLAATGIKD